MSSESKPTSSWFTKYPKAASLIIPPPPQNGHASEAQILASKNGLDMFASADELREARSDNVTCLIDAQGRTQLCHVLIQPTPAKGGTGKPATPGYFSAMGMDWGHIVARSFGGPGSVNGNGPREYWNLMPQLMEANRLQESMVEQFVWRYLEKGVNVEYIVRPVWRESKDVAAEIKNMPVELMFFLRPEGRNYFRSFRFPTIGKPSKAKRAASPSGDSVCWTNWPGATISPPNSIVCTRTLTAQSERRSLNIFYSPPSKPPEQGAVGCHCHSPLISV